MVSVPLYLIIKVLIIHDSHGVQKKAGHWGSNSRLRFHGLCPTEIPRVVSLSVGVLEDVVVAYGFSTCVPPSCVFLLHGMPVEPHHGRLSVFLVGSFFGWFKSPFVRLFDNKAYWQVRFWAWYP